MWYIQTYFTIIFSISQKLTILFFLLFLSIRKKTFEDFYLFEFEFPAAVINKSRVFGCLWSGAAIETLGILKLYCARIFFPPFEGLRYFKIVMRAQFLFSFSLFLPRIQQVVPGNFNRFFNGEIDAGYFEGMIFFITYFNVV